MKAITLTQPWASLVDMRKKQIETRSWHTPYRGELVIHAAKGYPVWAKNLAWQPEFRNALGWQADMEKLVRGAALCVVRLVACVPTTGLHKLDIVGIKPHISEVHFGDYSEGRWAWAFEYVRHLETPVPMRGALGLWDVPEGVTL